MVTLEFVELSTWVQFPVVTPSAKKPLLSGFFVLGDYIAISQTPAIHANSFFTSSSSDFSYEMIFE